MIKNTLLATVAIFLLGHLCLLGLAWWWIVPLAALVGFGLSETGLTAFLAGFLGGLALWCGYAFWADTQNGGVLSAKIGQLFLGLSSVQLILVTGVLGGLLAGMGALTGKMARNLLLKPKRRNYLQERRR